MDTEEPEPAHTSEENIISKLLEVKVAPLVTIALTGILGDVHPLIVVET
jgi:hypothetical protein